MARVGLVVVSHSDLLARGVVEVAAQMAPDVTLTAAGGTDDGGIGTSFDRVEAAVASTLEATGGTPGSGVVLLTDLGSATLTVESVLDMAEDPDHLVLADGPLVEGAVAAAVRAQLGDDVAGVARAAREAGASFAPPASPAPPSSTPAPTVPTPLAPPAPPTVGALTVVVPPGEDEGAEGDAVVADPVGLHARPAALFARLAGTFESEVTLDGADAGSVLEIMGLGIRQGQTVHLVAHGPDAPEAVRALTEMLETAPSD